MAEIVMIKLLLLGYLRKSWCLQRCLYEIVEKVCTYSAVEALWVAVERGETYLKT